MASQILWMPFMATPVEYPSEEILKTASLPQRTSSIWARPNYSTQFANWVDLVFCWLSEQSITSIDTLLLLVYRKMIKGKGSWLNTQSMPRGFFFWNYQYIIHVARESTWYYHSIRRGKCEKEVGERGRQEFSQVG